MTENVKTQASPLVKKKRLRFNLPRILLHVLFIIAVLACVLPFVLVIAISFTSETSVIKDGFQFIPKVFSAEAYASILGSEQSLFQLLRAYGVTILFFLCRHGHLHGDYGHAGLHLVPGRVLLQEAADHHAGHHHVFQRRPGARRTSSTPSCCI